MEGVWLASCGGHQWMGAPDERPLMFAPAWLFSSLFTSVFILC